MTRMVIAFPRDQCSLFLLQFALGADKKMLMRLERKGEHAEVSEEEHHGDAQRELALDRRAPAARARVRGAMKDGRDDEGDRGERKRDDGGARAGLVEALFLVLRPAEQDGETEHEQDVADDRAGDRRFDHADVAFVKRDAGDDQLGGVPESGVQ